MYTMLLMADTMLHQYKVWVNLCVYTQTKQYTPITSAIPQKGLLLPLGPISQSCKAQKVGKHNKNYAYHETRLPAKIACHMYKFVSLSSVLLSFAEQNIFQHFILLIERLYEIGLRLVFSEVRTSTCS